MASLFSPISRSLAQLHDPVFVGVVLRSVAWAIGGFALLHFAVAWAMDQWLPVDGPLAWIAQIAGFIGTSLLAFWLFVPLAAAIGALHVESIAGAVERRHFPYLPPAPGAPILEQVVDTILLGLRILGFIALGLLMALMLPGVGLILGWAVTAYAIGRGLFVAVAMRRMLRGEAERVYRQHRGIVLAQGAILALGASIPLVNLLLPVIGIAAMVHVLDDIMTA